MHWLHGLHTLEEGVYQQWAHSTEVALAVWIGPADLEQGRGLLSPAHDAPLLDSQALAKELS